MINSVTVKTKSGSNETHTYSKIIEAYKEQKWIKPENGSNTRQISTLAAIAKHIFDKTPNFHMKTSARFLMHTPINSKSSSFIRRILMKTLSEVLRPQRIREEYRTKLKIKYWGNLRTRRQKIILIVRKMQIQVLGKSLWILTKQIV